MNFEETAACGINKRKFEISMSDEEVEQYQAFLDWLKESGNDASTLTIAWGEEKNDDGESVAEDTEDFYGPMFKTLDTVCDDIPDDADFKPFVEEITDEMAAYFES